MNAIFTRSIQSTRLTADAALWLKAFVLLTFLAASSAPSPLYTIYRTTWGFSALTLTVVFASYAFALLLALLVFGSLSDYLGRRSVLVSAIVIEIISIVLFWQAQSVGWLLAARIVQGLATGIATSTLNAGLIDLHRERGPLVNSVAPLLGMAVGAFGTSVLVQFAPEPTKLVFELLLLVLVLQATAALYLPETNERRTGAWRSMRPAIAIPVAARKTLWQVLPVNTAQWALGGFYLSLGPSLAFSVTGSHVPVVGGAFVAALVLSSAIAVMFVRRHAPRLVLMGGTMLLASGLAITLAGIYLHSTAILFLGTAIAGLGFGAAFNGSIRSLAPLASQNERAGLMSGFFALSYLAFSVPAILAGLGVGHFGLQTTSLFFGAALIVLALFALISMQREAQ